MEEDPSPRVWHDSLKLDMTRLEFRFTKKKPSVLEKTTAGLQFRNVQQGGSGTRQQKAERHPFFDALA